MKTCSTCKIKKETTDFYRNKNTKDNLQSNCKQCSNASSLKSHQKYKDKWQKHYRISRKKYREEYKKREIPLYKRKARAKVYKAIKTGKIIKGVCHCGNNETEGHHTDYSKPLRVEWLCRLHHIEKHNNLNRKE